MDSRPAISALRALKDLVIIAAVLFVTWVVPVFLVRGCINREHRRTDEKHEMVLAEALEFLKPSKSVVSIKAIRITDNSVVYFIESPVTKKNRVATLPLRQEDKPIEEGSEWIVEPLIKDGKENFKFLEKVKPLSDEDFNAKEIALKKSIFQNI